MGNGTPESRTGPAIHAAIQETLGLDDEQFLLRMGEKIQRLTGHPVELRVDAQDLNKLQVDLDGEIPLLVVGANIYQYAGFARMCIEYATASIQRQRPIDLLEFHLLLARN